MQIADEQRYQDFIDAQRLEAANAEWERGNRVRQVLAGSAERAAEQVRALATAFLGCRELADAAAEVEGIAEVLRGSWLVSPRAMLAQRTGQAAPIATDDNEGG